MHTNKPTSTSEADLALVPAATAAAGGAAGTGPVCLALDSSHRNALSDAFIRDTIEALPVKPDHISDIRGPYLEVRRNADVPTAVDVRVTHQFKAHFDGRSPSSTVTSSHTNPPQIEELSPLVRHPSDDPPAPVSPQNLALARGEARSATGDGPSGQHSGICHWHVDPRDVSIGRRLAVGGFGEVFVGSLHGTIIAVKVLLNVDSSAQERFLREVAVLASLRHPNIVLFMGFTMKPHLAILSEFMSRGSLYKVLRSGGDKPLEPRLQRNVAISVARGMAYLHSRSPPLLHLDLKSPNVLVDERWRVKIADFGLSRLRVNTFLTGEGGGTSEWMAPEILRSENCVDEHADVYSYGVILWEILTGQAPWEGMHPMQVVGAVGFQGCSLPLDFPPDTDEYLAELCARCLSKSPSNRPTFPEIVRELEARYNARLELGMHSKLSESRSSIGLSSDAGSDSNERLLLPPPPWAAMASQDDRPTDAHADTSYGTPGGGKDQVPDASPFANLAAQPFSSDTPLGGLPPFSQQPSTMETIRAQPDSAPTDQENNNNNPELGHCVRLSDASDGTLGHGFRLAGLEGSTSLPEGPTLEDVDDAGLRWTVNAKEDSRGDVELLSAALDSAQL